MKIDGDAGSECCEYTYDGRTLDALEFAPLAHSDLSVALYVHGDMVHDHITKDCWDMCLIVHLDDIIEDFIDGNEHGLGGPIDEEDARPWINRMRQWADVLEARIG